MNKTLQIWYWGKGTAKSSYNILYFPGKYIFIKRPLKAFSLLVILQCVHYSCPKVFDSWHRNDFNLTDMASWPEK